MGLHSSLSNSTPTRLRSRFAKHFAPAPVAPALTPGLRVSHTNTAGDVYLARLRRAPQQLISTHRGAILRRLRSGRVGEWIVYTASPPPRGQPACGLRTNLVSCFNSANRSARKVYNTSFCAAACNRRLTYSWYENCAETDTHQGDPQCTLQQSSP
jgi:hypothetical protein